jgi:hypothetical protein
MLGHEVVGRNAGLIVGDDVVNLGPVRLTLQRSCMARPGSLRWPRPAGLCEFRRALTVAAVIEPAADWALIAGTHSLIASTPLKSPSRWHQAVWSRHPGLHTGAVELRGDDITGLGVVIARRVCDLAAADELLASWNVKDLTIGNEIGFVDRGVHALKAWRAEDPFASLIQALSDPGREPPRRAPRRCGPQTEE